MRIRSRLFRAFLGALATAALAVGGTGVLAGTDVRIVAQDASVLSARSMDFGTALESRIVTVPRGAAFSSPATAGAGGASWSGRHGFVYLDGFGLDVAFDGLNEAGLGVAAMFLPGETRYPDGSADTALPALSNLQLGAWALSQFDSVDEVRQALARVGVFGERVPSLGNWPLPLHFAVHDARGNSLVLEWLDGELRMHDNTVGVLTNAPAFDWHLTNLKQFGRLAPLPVHPIQIGSLSYAVTGHGTALAGLPGDPSSASRFVSTAAALNLADRPKDVIGAMILAQKLMNRVDIPRGLVRDHATDRRLDDHTQWASFRDHTNRKYYWRSYHDQTLRELDLKTLDLARGAPKRRAAIAVKAPSAIQMKSENLPALRD